MYGFNVVKVDVERAWFAAILLQESPVRTVYVCEQAGQVLSLIHKICPTDKDVEDCKLGFIPINWAWYIPVLIVIAERVSPGLTTYVW